MSIELFYDDCLNRMSLLQEKSIDLILVDPPYGSTKCKWDIMIPLDIMWKEIKRIIKDNTAICIFGNQPFTSYLILSNIEMYRYDWLWQKDKAANWMFGNKMPLKICENISIFYKSQPTYNPQKILNPNGMSKRHLSRNPSKITKNVKDVMGDAWKETKLDETENYHGKNYEADKLLPTQLIYYSREQRGKVHPTQKPVKLLEYLIKTYSHENDTVLDFCMGSGSTGIAAKNLNRNFIGIENNLEYFTIASNRINNHIII